MSLTDAHSHAHPAPLGQPPTPYRLGAPIELPELLALPPDDNRYTRDEHGRLAIMSPDRLGAHRWPLCSLVSLLNRRLAPPLCVLQEPAIAFPRIYDLRGNLLRESFLGPKTLVPDIACFAQRPRSLEASHGVDVASPEHLRLVIEVLSPRTWRADLGVGSADDVDRMRSYLESGVPEYWVLNPALDDPSCPIRPRSGWFLVRDGEAWRRLPVEGGRVRSAAVPELELDLEAYFRECAD